MNKPFAIDIDDVLGPLSRVLNPALNEDSGKNIPISAWDNFVLTGIYGISMEQFLHAIVSRDLLSIMPVEPTSRQALTQIKESGAGIVLITSRGYYPNAEQVTQDWLAKHDLPYDDLIVVPEGTSKGQIAKSRYPKGFVAMVDDHTPNLDSMRAEGLVKETILINKPWNQTRTDYRMGVNRFACLNDYIEHLASSARTERSELQCAS